MVPVQMDVEIDREEEMIKQVGASLARVKKRVHDTHITYQIKPPDVERDEILAWSSKVKSLVEFKDTMHFPSVLDVKRRYAKKQHKLAQARANEEKKKEEVKEMHSKLAAISHKKMLKMREGKTFGPTKNFGMITKEGEAIRTIERYEGINSEFSGQRTQPRTLVRKDGRFTNYTTVTAIPEWIGPQYYGNLDPAALNPTIRPDSAYEVPFRQSSRQAKTPSEQMKEERIERRNRLDSWKYREMGPHYTHDPVHWDREWSPDARVRGSSSRQGKGGGDYYSFGMNTNTTSRGASRHPTTPAIDVLSRSPPKIILGELTRQLLLVELEEKIRANSPPSIRALAREPTPAALKAAEMLATKDSFFTKSNSFAAKLHRYEHGGNHTWQGRTDYTLGALTMQLPEQDMSNLFSPYNNNNSKVAMTNAKQDSSNNKDDCLHGAKKEGYLADASSSSSGFQSGSYSSSVLRGAGIVFSPVQSLLKMAPAALEGDEVHLPHGAVIAATKTVGDGVVTGDETKKHHRSNHNQPQKNAEATSSSSLDPAAPPSPDKVLFAHRVLPLTSPIGKQIKKWFSAADIYHPGHQGPQSVGELRKIVVKPFVNFDGLMLNEQEATEMVVSEQEMAEYMAVLDEEEEEREKKLQSESIN